jgi:hypothetical protein
MKIQMQSKSKSRSKSKSKSMNEGAGLTLGGLRSRQVGGEAKNESQRIAKRNFQMATLREETLTVHGK